MLFDTVGKMSSYVTYLCGLFSLRSLSHPQKSTFTNADDYYSACMLTSRDSHAFLIACGDDLLSVVSLLRISTRREYALSFSLFMSCNHQLIRKEPPGDFSLIKCC